MLKFFIMSSEKSVPKRNHRKAFFLGAFFPILLLTAYITWAHLSAIMVLRWFVRENEIPLTISRASWDVRPRELLRGKIRDLHLDVFYEPLQISLTLDTPVEYSHRAGHWSVALKPIVTIGDFPPARGTLALELETAKGKSLAESAEVTLHLHEARPLLLQSKTGAVSADTWTVDGVVRWAKLWSSELEFKFKNAKLRNAGSTRTLSVKALTIAATTTWPGKPPVPFDMKGHLSADGLTFLDTGLFLEEPQLLLDAGFHFDGSRFEQVDLSVDKPIKLKAKGDFGAGSLHASYNLHGDLEELITRRAVPWLEGQLPLLHRATAKGSLSLSGQLLLAPPVPLNPHPSLSATGSLVLDAKSVELPSRDLYIDGASLRLPLLLSGTPGWGDVKIKTLEFHSVKLKNLTIRTRLGASGLDVTTEDAKGGDRPIRQSVWGGSIDIAELYAHLGGKQGTEFTASVTGGPFALPAVQSDLCLMPQHPLTGSLSFTYPDIVLNNGTLALVGDTNLELFNGKAHIGDMSLAAGTNGTRLRFDMDWSDLDLHAIGDWTNIGDMRGSLGGFLRKTDIALTPNGAIPQGYDLSIQGQKRAGNKMSFYGRAMGNIMALFGIPLDSMPAYQTPLIKLGILIRNWLPAKADVLGIMAKSDGNWTTVTTFDPPSDEADNRWCENGKHYILCGNGFTIPLNTHGIYPVFMKTAAFHEWLSGRAQVIQTLMKNKSTNKSETGRKNENQEPQCTSLF